MSAQSWYAAATGIAEIELFRAYFLNTFPSGSALQTRFRSNSSAVNS